MSSNVRLSLALRSTNHFGVFVNPSEHLISSLLMRRNMFAWICRYAVHMPIYGLGQSNVMALKKCARRLLILDQCFGIGSLGPDYMAFGYGQILLLGDDIAPPRRPPAPTSPTLALPPTSPPRLPANRVVD